MRQVTAAETLALKAMLEMEASALAVANAGLMAISDPELQALAKSGIMAQQARIQGLQQFVMENNIAQLQKNNRGEQSQTQTNDKAEGGLFEDVFGQ